MLGMMQLIATSKTLKISMVSIYRGKENRSVFEPIRYCEYGCGIAHGIKELDEDHIYF